MDINNYEYGVDQLVEGKIKTRRTLLLIIYFVFAAGAFTAVFASKWLPLGAVVPFLIYILILATWRYVQIDNKYLIDKGHLFFTRKYGNSKPKAITDFLLKEAELIAPISKSSAKIEEYAAKNVYSGLASKASMENGYVALYKNSEGEKCCLYFEVTPDTIKVLKYYNSNTVV